MRRAGLTWDGDPRVKPPFGAAEIDWGHPLARSLDGLWLFNEGAGVCLDSVRRNDAVLSGAAASHDVSADGRMLRLNAGDAVTSFAAISTRVIAFASGENFTIGVRFRTTDDYGMLCALRSAASGNPIADLAVGYNGLDDNATKICGSYRDDAGAGLALLTNGLVVNDGLVHSAVLVRDGSTIYVRTDGTNELSGAGSSSACTFTTDQQAFGAERNWIATAYGTADQRYLDAVFVEAFIARRAWSMADLQEFHTEPYAMLRPRVARRYFVPAGVAGATGGARIFRRGRRFYRSQAA